MARITIAQLTEQLEHAHIAYQKLEAKYESLLAERAERAVQKVNAPEHQRVVAISSYRETLRLAREAAIRTGKSVLVTRN